MLNDLTLLVYIDQAKYELSKGERWMSISPRLALEIMEELACYRRIYATPPKTALQTAHHNEDTQK